MKVLTVVDAASWNSFLANMPDAQLMQSDEWGEFKSKSGWMVKRVALEEDDHLVAGAQILLKKLPLSLGRIGYISKGPVVDWNDRNMVDALFSAIDAVCRKERVAFLKIEPHLTYSPDAVDRLRSWGFRRSRGNNHPQSTILVDLKPELNEILARMRKSARRNIQRSQRDGVTVREGDEKDLPIIYDLIRHTSRRAGFSARSYEYYHEEWKALANAGWIKSFLAVYNGEVIAVSMDTVMGQRAISLHSGSLEQYHDLKANDLLIWEAIKWAKSRGCVTYDLWGIPDEIGEMLHRGEEIPENNSGGLWGVYYFKKGFGGYPVYFVGTYDLVYVRFPYEIVKFGERIVGSLASLALLRDRLKPYSRNRHRGFKQAESDRKPDFD